MVIPTLRCPLVFVHGLLGFDYLRLGNWRLACYWSKIPESFASAGNRVLVARVSPLGTVAQRAAELKAFIERESPDEPVHLIGHSMGGLDSRYLISRLGMENRVLTLTTVATPHRGTAIADWVLLRWEPVFGFFFDLCGISRQALHDLTLARCQAFNEEVPDSPRVRYFSVAGKFQAPWFTPLWRMASRVVEKEEGPNDGLVSLSSAAYGEGPEVWNGDHVSLVNFPNPLARIRGKWEDRVPAYGRLVRRLVDEGY